MKAPPKELRDLLKKYDRKIQQGFLEALALQKSNIRIAKVVEALKAGDLGEAYRAVRIDERYFSQMKTLTRDAYWGGGRQITGSVRGAVTSQPVIPFDGSMPRAEKWVQTQTARLVTNVAEEQRALARFVIQEGLAAGASPQTVALDLVGRINKITKRREGGFIGLTERMTKVSKDMRLRLSTPDGMQSYLNLRLRDRRFDPAVKKALRDGTSLRANTILKLATRYEARALAYRGKVIAENEARIAVEAGRAEAFQQMFDDGTITAEQTTKFWRHSPSKDPRPEHIAMDGESVPVTASFSLPDGTVMRQPHDPAGGAEHNINCNCWTDYVVGPRR